jgi:hypothetical protein
MTPIFPDAYDQWSLERYACYGDRKVMETLFEGTEDHCRQFAYENYTDKEQTDMCLVDWEGREWDV